MSVTRRLRKSIVKLCPRKKSRPSRPSTPALGGNVWARTGQKGKGPAFLPQGSNPIQNDPRHKLDSATGRDLDAVGLETRVIADGDQHGYAYQGSGCSGVEGQPQDAAAAVWTPYFYANEDQALPGIERETHRTTAVRSGILPV
jgi:hypothetical protein